MSDLKFDKDFETDKEIPKAIGRLAIGKSIARIYLHPDGHIHIHGPDTMRPYIHMYDTSSKTLYGFGK